MLKVVIVSIKYYFPSLYVDIEELATARDIPSEKLVKGLGLKKMATPDYDEDSASIAANSLYRLIKENNIDPRKIGRVYLGTESGVDASKPTSSYVVEIIEDVFAGEYGERCFKNCDIVDLTFACAGAVDALQNCCDWVRNGKNDNIKLRNQINWFFEKCPKNNRSTKKQYNKLNLFKQFY